MSFFSESIKEFDHVVWPTKADTIKYFNIVVSMIVGLTILLFVVGTALSTGLFAIKSQITPIKSSTSTQSSSSTTLPKLNLDGLKTGTAPAATPKK